MVAVDLDQAHIDRLNSLAKSRGGQAADLARQIIVDFLDLESLPADSDADWAEASVGLSAAILDHETWDDNTDGS